MPHAVDSLRLGKKFDRRIKIQKSEHVHLRAKREAGQSMRSLAREYNVDRRLIQFIIYPERQRAANKLHNWRKYYDKDKWRETMREHRAYKKKILGQV